MDTKQDQPSSEEFPSISDGKKKGNILVVLRSRPATAVEQGLVKSGSSVEFLDLNTVCVRTPTRTDQYMFDLVAGEHMDQHEFYMRTVYKLIEKLIQGYSVTIMCYGSTGSGKTYSLSGLNSEAQMGVVPRMLGQLAEIQRALAEQGCTMTFTVSFIEVYAERPQDLLAPTKSGEGQNLAIRQDATGFYVQGVTTHTCETPSDIHKLYKLGNVQRSMGSTKMNTKSSRSHSILKIDITIKEPSGDVKKSVCCVVDLAGSENATDAGVEGTSLQESKAINTSLFELGNVISDLSRNKKPTFNNSALTKLLKNSIGGKAETLIINAISPSPLSISQTIFTVEKAAAMKNIQARPVANCAIIGVSNSALVQHLQHLNQQYEKLKALVESEKGGAASFERLQKFLRHSITSYEEARDQVLGGLEPIQKLATALQRERLSFGMVLYQLSRPLEVLGTSLPEKLTDMLLRRENTVCLFNMDSGAHQALAEAFKLICGEDPKVLGAKLPSMNQSYEVLNMNEILTVDLVEWQLSSSWQISEALQGQLASVHVTQGNNKMLQSSLDETAETKEHLHIEAVQIQNECSAFSKRFTVAKRVGDEAAKRGLGLEKLLARKTTELASWKTVMALKRKFGDCNVAMEIMQHMKDANKADQLFLKSTKGVDEMNAELADLDKRTKAVYCHAETMEAQLDEKSLENEREIGKLRKIVTQEVKQISTMRSTIQDFYKAANGSAKAVKKMLSVFEDCENKVLAIQEAYKKGDYPVVKRLLLGKEKSGVILESELDMSIDFIVHHI